MLICSKHSCGHLKIRSLKENVVKTCRWIHVHEGGLNAGREGDVRFYPIDLLVRRFISCFFHHVIGSFTWLSVEVSKDEHFVSVEFLLTLLQPVHHVSSLVPTYVVSELKLLHRVVQMQVDHDEMTWVCLSRGEIVLDNRHLTVSHSAHMQDFVHDNLEL